MALSREVTPQEILMAKLKVLLPDAICNIRPYDNNEHLVDHPVRLGDFLIDWPPVNPPLPSFDEIDAIPMEQVKAQEEVYRKRDRDARLENDLSIKACYLIEKKDKPDLKFSDYLDYLESM